MPFLYSPKRNIPDLVKKVILLTGGNSLLSQHRVPARAVTDSNQELPELAKKPSSNLPNTIPSTSTSLDVIPKQPTQSSQHASHVTRHHSAPSPKLSKYSSKSLKTSSISLQTINDAFSLQNNMFSFLNWELLSKIRIGVILAIFFW